MSHDKFESFENYEPRVRQKKRGSKPRSKNRPNHESAVVGLVIGVDRGRFKTIVSENSPEETVVSCTRSSELRSHSIVTGDRVRVIGDVSGLPGTLARIVKIDPRQTILRRSADDSDTIERVIVANADQLLMVVAATKPEPRLRLIDRYLVAALDAGLKPIMCVTKTDLASPKQLSEYVLHSDVEVVERSATKSARKKLIKLLEGHITVAVGHSGVGKSSLVNDLVPDAMRTVGEVNTVTGRGRHTSSSSQAFRIPEGGWVIDTPGVRSFGLGHVHRSTVISGFPELLDLTLNCPRACVHLPDSGECLLNKPEKMAALTGRDRARLTSFQRIMTTLQDSDNY